MNEAALLVNITELVSDIELSLKGALETHLRQVHGTQWRQALPSSVRRNATNRYRWSVAQIGARRAGEAEAVIWLSMGDTMRSLERLEPEA